MFSWSRPDDHGSDGKAPPPPSALKAWAALLQGSLLSSRVPQDPTTATATTPQQADVESTRADSTFHKHSRRYNQFVTVTPKTSDEDPWAHYYAYANSLNRANYAGSNKAYSTIGIVRTTKKQPNHKEVSPSKTRSIEQGSSPPAHATSAVVSPHNGPPKVSQSTYGSSERRGSAKIVSNNNNNTQRRHAQSVYAGSRGDYDDRDPFYSDYGQYKAPETQISASASPVVSPSPAPAAPQSIQEQLLASMFRKQQKAAYRRQGASYSRSVAGGSASATLRAREYDRSEYGGDYSTSSSVHGRHQQQEKPRTATNPLAESNPPQRYHRVARTEFDPLDWHDIHGARNGNNVPARQAPPPRPQRIRPHTPIVEETEEEIDDGLNDWGLPKILVATQYDEDDVEADEEEDGYMNMDAENVRDADEEESDIDSQGRFVNDEDLDETSSRDDFDSSDSDDFSDDSDDARATLQSISKSFSLDQIRRTLTEDAAANSTIANAPAPKSQSRIGRNSVAAKETLSESVTNHVKPIEPGPNGSSARKPPIKRRDGNRTATLRSTSYSTTSTAVDNTLPRSASPVSKNYNRTTKKAQTKPCIVLFRQAVYWLFLVSPLGTRTKLNYAHTVQALLSIQRRDLRGRQQQLQRSGILALILAHLYIAAIGNKRKAQETVAPRSLSGNVSSAPHNHQPPSTRQPLQTRPVFNAQPLTSPPAAKKTPSLYSDYSLSRPHTLHRDSSSSSSRNKVYHQTPPAPSSYKSNTSYTSYGAPVWSRPAATSVPRAPPPVQADVLPLHNQHAQGQPRSQRPGSATSNRSTSSYSRRQDTQHLSTNSYSLRRERERSTQQPGPLRQQEKQDNADSDFYSPWGV